MWPGPVSGLQTHLAWQLAQAPRWADLQGPAAGLQHLGPTPAVPLAPLLQPPQRCRLALPLPDQPWWQLRMAGFRVGEGK